MTRLWYVVTPEYGTVIPILDYGQGPMEYGCDVIEVRARSAREAVRLGVMLMLAIGDPPYSYVNERNGSPYRGVHAEPGPIKGKGWIVR